METIQDAGEQLAEELLNTDLSSGEIITARLSDLLPPPLVHLDPALLVEIRSGKQSEPFRPDLPAAGASAGEGMSLESRCSWPASSETTGSMPLALQTPHADDFRSLLQTLIAGNARQHPYH